MIVEVEERAIVEARVRARAAKDVERAKIAYTHQWNWLSCRCVNCEIEAMDFMDNPQVCSKKSAYIADDFASIRQHLQEMRTG